MSEVVSQTICASPPAAVAARPDARSVAVVGLFAGALFLSALLMFLVEPMIARMVLPTLGGSPSVWNTCLVFFQAMLLAGYAYAHAVTTYLDVRRQVAIHVIVLFLPLLALPIGLQNAPAADPDHPVGWLLMALTASIGLPFFVLATSAAVLQKWFAATDERSAADPYFLYAASNLGSFVGLLAYPFLVERTLRLQDQARYWAMGYAVLVALMLVCALHVWRRAAAPARAIVGVREAPPIAWGRRTRWVALSFVPSSLLLAVTSHISTNVASVPLLWILPLSLYLLSFVIAFSPSSRTPRAVAVRMVPLVVVVLALILIADMGTPLTLIIPLHLAALLAIATASHGHLADDRPAPARLTEFYLCLSVGGMLGGVFNALLAPVIFEGIAEYPLVLVAACLLRQLPGTIENRRFAIADFAVPMAIGGAAAVSILINNQFGSLSRFIILGAALPALVAFNQQRHRFRFAAAIALILLAGTLTKSPFGEVVFEDRTFYGVNRVRVDEDRGYRLIFHGTTVHGMQSLDPARQHEPLSYFHRSGPIGQLFAAVPAAAATPHVAVLGLGVGTLASYRRPGQHWTFYEIDPAVERIARDDRYFTYLRTCGGDCTVITGDGRITLGRSAPHRFGVIMLDAFSSDAVPMHLMTKESLALYLSKLAPGGVIVFNISNWHLSFNAVLARMVADAGLHALWQREPPHAGSWALGKFPSEWLVVAREQRDFGALTGDPRWSVPQAPSGTPLWTDDFSNILSVVRR